MKNHLSTFTLLAGALLLTGCGVTKRVPDYACPLQGVEAGACASMQDAYSASKKVAPGKTSKVQSVFDTRAMAAGHQGAGQGTGVPVVGAQLSSLTSPTKAAPVYIQPRVMQVWLAPYKDSANNLRSGENVYFATEGRWNYGSLNEAGAASSSTFQPTRPRPDSPVISAGARPVVTKTNAANSEQARPSAPPEATAAAKEIFQATAPKAPTGPVTLQPNNGGGITQPYDRIGEQ